MGAVRPPRDARPRPPAGVQLAVGEQIREDAPALGVGRRLEAEAGIVRGPQQPGPFGADDRDRGRHQKWSGPQKMTSRRGNHSSSWRTSPASSGTPRARRTGSRSRPEDSPNSKPAGQIVGQPAHPLLRFGRGPGDQGVQVQGEDHHRAASAEPHIGVGRPHQGVDEGMTVGDLALDPGHLRRGAFLDQVADESLQGGAALPGDLVHPGAVLLCLPVDVPAEPGPIADDGGGQHAAHAGRGVVPVGAGPQQAAAAAGVVALIEGRRLIQVPALVEGLHLEGGPPRRRGLVQLGAESHEGYAGPPDAAVEAIRDRREQQAQIVAVVAHVRGRLSHEARRQAAPPVVGMGGDAADAAHAHRCGAEVDVPVPDAQGRHQATIEVDDLRVRRAPGGIALDVAPVALVPAGVVGGAEEVDELVELGLAERADGLHGIRRGRRGPGRRGVRRGGTWPSGGGCPWAWDVSSS